MTRTHRLTRRMVPIRVLGPLARPIPRLEPSVPAASTLAFGPVAQPPPRSADSEERE